MRDRRLLLILDTCEHQLAACAELARTLLRACPGVQLVATSRQPLGLADEQLEALVRRDAPREADRQHLRVERALGRLDVRAQVAAPQAVGRRAAAQEVDEVGALGSTARHLRGLVGRARESGLAVVLATQGPSDLQAVDRSLLSQVLQDTAWQVVFRQGSPDDAELSPAQLRLLALEGAAQLVRDIAMRGTAAVVVLDDLHAADPDSLEVVRYLTNAQIGHTTIAGALRPGEGPLADELARALRRDGATDVVELAPLEPRAVNGHQRM